MYKIIILGFIFFSLCGNNLFAQEEENGKSSVYSREESLLLIKEEGVASSYVPLFQFYLKDSILKDVKLYHRIKNCTSEEWCYYNNNYAELMIKDPFGIWTAHVLPLIYVNKPIARYVFRISNRLLSYSSTFETSRYNKNEIRGHSRPFSIVLSEFEYLKKPLDEGKEIVCSTRDLETLFREETSVDSTYESYINNGIITLIKNAQLVDTKLYKYYDDSLIDTWDNETLQRTKLLLVQSSQPIFPDSVITKESPTFDANAPIMLVDEKNHKNRADSEDWRIYTHVNSNNGDFFQYFLFDPEKELNMPWPLYIRDFAMDYLAGTHICKYSTVAVMKKSHEKVVKRTKYGFTPELIRIAKINDKQWRPAPVPKDKNTIPKNRLFFEDNPGRIFGSYAKIWDLKIWFEVPRMLRENPEGVYLVGYGSLLQLADIPDPIVEQKLLSECGILITPTLYKQLESLRRLQKSQLKTEKK